MNSLLTIITMFIQNQHIIVFVRSFSFSFCLFLLVVYLTKHDFWFKYETKKEITKKKKKHKKILNMGLYFVFSFSFCFCSLCPSLCVLLILCSLVWCSCMFKFIDTTDWMEKTRRFRSKSCETIRQEERLIRIKYHLPSICF